MHLADNWKKNLEKYLPLLLVVMLLAGFPFFFLGGPGYHGSRSFVALWDLGHILFFSLFSLLVIVSARKKGFYTSSLRFFGLLFGSVFLIGITVELMQGFLENRNVSGKDLYFNQLGCLLAFSITGLRIGKMRQTMVRACVLLLIILAVRPLGQVLYDERVAVKQFPVLSDFETGFEQTRWRDIRQIERQAEVVRSGGYGLRIRLSTATYSGVNLFYFPGDWHGYKTINFSVYNPDDQELALHVRIHDRHHKQHKMKFSDRFHKRFVVFPGWNDLTVCLQTVRDAPLDRQMDMADIENFGIFVIRQPRARIIYLDSVYLGVSVSEDRGQRTEVKSHKYKS